MADSGFLGSFANLTAQLRRIEPSSGHPGHTGAERELHVVNPPVTEAIRIFSDDRPATAEGDTSGSLVDRTRVRGLSWPAVATSGID